MWLVRALRGCSRQWDMIIRTLTTILLRIFLLLLLPSLLCLRNQVFSFVDGMVLDVLVMRLLQCPAVRNAVEDAS